MKTFVKRRGRFFGWFCDHAWVFVFSYDYCGQSYYKWCSKCDRLEHLGFIYNSSWEEERKELWEEMQLPPKEQMIQYCCHPDNGKDLIAHRKERGFI